jgi:hypothetical protein
MSQATGWSANFDFGEALKDAAGKLPPEDTNHPLGYTVTVTRIEGNFTRGIVPPHLEVTVQTGRYDQQSTGKRIEMANGAAGEQPNVFSLQGDNKQIHFSMAGFDGRPSFSYKDETRNIDLRGDQINILETRLWRQVTVTIEHVPDSHFVDLTLLIPTIFLPEGTREHPIETKAIVTTTRAPFTLPENITGQIQTYETLDLTGTSSLVMS